VSVFKQTAGLPNALSLGLMLACGCAQGAPTRWFVEEGSRLGFIANQAGADFEGRFEEFGAVIEFDADSLEESRFLVEVSLNSVATENDERDDILRSPDLFDAGRWPTSVFQASAFEHVGQNLYRAQGELKIRDVSNALTLPFEFTIEEDGARARLEGAVELSRLDYGVGQGEWKDTTWVADKVTAIFALRLVAVQSD